MSESTDHPCAPCAFFLPRTMQVFQMRFPVCVSPERLKDTGCSWTPCNRKGPKCEAWIKGTQLRLGGE